MASNGMRILMADDDDYIGPRTSGITFETEQWIGGADDEDIQIERFRKQSREFNERVSRMIRMRRGSKDETSNEQLEQPDEDSEVTVMDLLRR